MEKKLTAHISDTLRSLINLFATSRGADNSYEGADSSVRRLEAEEKETLREAAQRAMHDDSIAVQRERNEALRAASESERLRKESEARERREEKRREWNYRLSKDWLADFYKRNEIYMKTGKRTPQTFNTLLEKYMR